MNNVGDNGCKIIFYFFTIRLWIIYENQIIQIGCRDGYHSIHELR